MLDIKFIRENKDVVQMGAKKKHIDFDVEKLIEVDDERKLILAKVEEKRALQNEVSDKIPQSSSEEKEKLISEMTILKEDLQKEEEELKKVEEKWKELMLQVPNIPDISVPEGKEDIENKEIRVWGEKPNFDFKPKDHIELMVKNKMVDFERGTKVAGFRGYILKNHGSLLEQAIHRLVLDIMIKKGFSPMTVPSLVKRKTLLGTGYLPQGEDDLYKTQDDDYLAGTGEVSAMSFYADEVLEKEELPKKILAFSPCFRREAGSHSKDTKGLIRVHEFYKFEQVVLCEASHEESVKFHEEIRENSEEIMQALGIPYRVVINCGGDLGLGQVKKYDIEAWVPSQNTYRETHSASYFHDFQTRRLNIKYKDSDGSKKFVHSLNNTALATPRILVMIVENYQQADGSIKVPEVLKPYMYGVEVIKA
jgi:seryl-tRNA synthetase